MMGPLFKLARPILMSLEPEQAHGLTLAGLKTGLFPKACAAAPSLATTVCGLDFPNPIGIAAGFDKNGEVPDAMLRLGCGYAEVGSTTPKPQKGNPTPRIFRLPEADAVINRLGFNNQGHLAMKRNMKDRQGRPGIVGVNLGANKDTEDKAEDYVLGIDAFEGMASYFTINVSSPNTPGLRSLQGRQALQDLVGRVLEARISRVPVFLKIAPDLTADDRQDIADVALESAIDALIISNTTIARQGLVEGAVAQETGGLSGRPLFAMSTQVLSDMRQLTKGKVPLIGVGGISSGADAYTKIRAGASLVQLYTAMIYQGPALIMQIRRDLEKLLARDGFSSVTDAVGADVPV